jgi:hypothetical protein
VTYGSHAVLEVNNSSTMIPTNPQPPGHEDSNPDFTNSQPPQVLDAARKDELRRMNPLVRLFKGGVPRCRLDTDGVRRGRKRFLEQLTRFGAWGLEFGV